jgi:hypothetical protein
MRAAVGDQAVSFIFKLKFSNKGLDSFNQIGVKVFLKRRSRPKRSKDRSALVFSEDDLAIVH